EEFHWNLRSVPLRLAASPGRALGALARGSRLLRLRRGKPVRQPCGAGQPVKRVALWPRGPVTRRGRRKACAPQGVGDSPPPPSHRPTGPAGRVTPRGALTLAA